MENGERIKREAPRRQNPDRGFANMFGQPVGGGANGSQAESSSDNAWTNNVDMGVKLGYKVIEDQIQQGQRFAEQISSGSYGPSMMSGDVQDLAKNIQKYSEDSIQFYSKVIESLTSDMSGMGSKDFMSGNAMNQGVQGLMESFTRAFSNNAPNAASSNRSESSGTTESNGVNVACAVSSKRPVEININVQSAEGTLIIDRLYEHDIDKAPLTGITLERESASRLKLNVVVPDDHPAGHYSGVIYDPVDKNHCGTLSVTISD